jgi:hypothetical protein
MNEVLIGFDEMPELEQSFELELAPCGFAWIQTASLADLLETRARIELELSRRKSARD